MVRRGVCSLRRTCGGPQPPQSTGLRLPVAATTAASDLRLNPRYRVAVGAGDSLRGMRVFVTHNPEDLDAYYGRALVDLGAVPGVEIVLNPYGREIDGSGELIEAAAGCQVIVAHRSTGGPAEVFAAPECDGLLAFLRCAVDISTIDVEAASAAGVLVARAGKAFVPSTAELALGLLLAVARNIGVSTADYHGSIEPPQRPGRQLRDQTAAVLGYGAIGSYLCDLLAAVGMTVLVYEPDPDVVVPDSMTRCSSDEALAAADVVFPLAQATTETENLIDADALGSMKRGAVLINVSRGELLDEAAVAAALDSGHLGGLGLDVGRAADQRPSMMLASRPDVVATPHLGGLTPENADEQARSSVEQIRAIMDRALPPRAVNLERATRLASYWEVNR